MCRKKSIISGSAQPRKWSANLFSNSPWLYLRLRESGSNHAAFMAYFSMSASTSYNISVSLMRTFSQPAFAGRKGYGLLWDVGFNFA